MIRHYFSLNYDYNTILSFLERNHGINISKRTLLNRLNEYQLRRRHRNVDEEIVRECILRELDSSGSLLGYRSIWRILHSKYGINVPRSVVQVVLAELDPANSKYITLRCVLTIYSLTIIAKRNHIVTTHKLRVVECGNC